MTPTQADTLLLAVKDLRDDMGRRLDDVKTNLRGVNARLDVVDSRIGKVEMTEAIASALVVAAKSVADQKNKDLESHALSYRWRVTIAIAAIGATLAAIGQVLSGLRLFGFGQ